MADTLATDPAAYEPPGARRAMKVLSIVGARPQFVKLAPIAAEMTAAEHAHVIVHTGQHYDANMSDVFFADLRIPTPDVHLGVGSGSHGVQTGTMLAALDGVIAEHRPDWVLVYGDTNSTVAGALAAVKLHVPLAHLEAGLRSFNRRMPEEHNRVLTDHAADLCLAPTEVAMTHLAHEGLADRSVLVGDVMTRMPLPAGVDAEGAYLVSTIHRAENTDDPRRLAAIISGLAGLPLPVVIMAHPRLVARVGEFGLSLDTGSLHSTTPMSYPDMIASIAGAAGVVTDSGGLQKEAFLVRTPCTTVRTETEWTETVDLGWNVLATDLSALPALVTRSRPAETAAAPYGDGHAATRVVEVLAQRIA